MSPPAAIPEMQHAGVTRRRRPWLIVLLLLLSLPVAFAGVALLFFRDAADRTVRAAVAAADRADPRWRFADIEKDRVQVPDAENGALQVAAALKAMGGMSYPYQPTPQVVRGVQQFVQSSKTYDEVSKTAPEVAFNPEAFAAFAEELEWYAPALEEARKLAGMRRGRYPLTYAANPFMTLLPHVQDSRTIARLLHADVLLKAHQGDMDGALESCRAILGTAAALGDEPFAITMLVRVAEDGVALTGLERVLGQGTASDAALARLDADLDAEEAAPLLRTALRGERALMFDGFEKLAGGQVPIASVGIVPTAFLGGWGMKGPHMKPWLRYNQGKLLASLSEAVAIAEMPTQDQSGLLSTWANATPGRGGTLDMVANAPARMMLPATNSVAAAVNRSRARLRAARAAIAAERFRMARGRWPASLAEVAVPGGTPADPATGGPLIFRKVDGGLLIYGLGENLTDDGGQFDRKAMIDRKSDEGMKLWDPDRRRRPPPPPSRPPKTPHVEDAMPRSTRTFVALPVAEELTPKLTRLQQLFAPETPGARWVHRPTST